MYYSNGAREEEEVQNVTVIVQLKIITLSCTVESI
jgi:hypothetical protein